MSSNLLHILTSKWMILLPIFGVIPWGGMLIAMLSAWAIQGHPLYWFMHSYQYPVYISDIGATSLQPLFIVGVAVNVIVYLLTLSLIMLLRDRYDVWFEKKDGNHLTRNVSIASITFAALGQLGILFVSIFNTNIFSKVHASMLGLFILGIFISLILQCVQYWRMGAKNVGSRFNHSMISCILKIVFSSIGLALAVAFVFVTNASQSGAIEWSLAFFYNLIFFIFAYDLFVLNSSIQRANGCHPDDQEEKEEEEEEVTTYILDHESSYDAETVV